METRYASAELNVQEQVQNMQVNGQNFQQRLKIYYCNCAACKRVLGQFDPNTPLQNAINAALAQLQPAYKYCPECGARLGWNFGIIDYKPEVPETKTE